MRLTEHLNKISWSIADKSTYVLYGIATIAILRVTNDIEFGIFTLFNSLHNLILNISDSFALQSILQFSAFEEEKPRINLIAIFNHIIVVSVFVSLILIFSYPLADTLGEPKIIELSKALPILAMFSIPRYFCNRIMYRELKIFRLFLTNLVYFGTMSGIIIYCIIYDIFLSYKSIIYITYIGAAAGTLVAILLTLSYWKFSLKGKTKYLDVIKFSFKYTITGIILPLPKYCDVFIVQYFFGTSIVGLYAPAKNIFRFVDEAINTVSSLIYAPSVKFIVKKDIKSLNSLLSKSISVMFVGFIILTILCFIGISDYFSSFLPNKFSDSIPIFNFLMLASILLPITLLNTPINAIGKSEVIAKYVLISIIFWGLSFIVIGVYFNSYINLIPVPFIIFLLVLSILLFRYSKKHFDIKFIQLFRVIPDAIMFIKRKFSL